MESLYLLLPLSVLLVLALIGLFAWALHGGQFEDLEREGWRLLEGDNAVVVPPPRSAATAEAHSPTLDLAQSERDSALPTIGSTDVEPRQEAVEPRSSP